MAPSVPAHPAATWKAFRLIALGLAIGTMGATLISPLFPLYQTQWQLATSTITLIFVCYMGGVLAAFLFLGQLTNHLGPLVVLRAALVVMLVGLGLSAFAPSPGWLIASRIAVGIGSGMITTSATLGLTQFEPPTPLRRAAIVASITTMVGFGFGPLLGGVIAQWLPWPTVLPFVLVALPTAVVLAGLLSLRNLPVEPRAERLSFRPRFVVPAHARPAFGLVSMSVFTAFALFSLIASLAPSFLNEILPWHGPAVSGTAIALVLFCSAGIQLPMRRAPSLRSLRLGLCSLATSVVCLAAALLFRSPPLFFTADLLIGLGHGMTFMASLSLVTELARNGDRAGILSSFLSVGYIGAIVPILAVGWLADHIGTSAAVVAFSVTFAVIALSLLAATRTVFGRVATRA